MRTIIVVLFEGFEHLDADGPLTFFGRLEDTEIICIAEQTGPVRGANSRVAWHADLSFQQLGHQIAEGVRNIDWLLVPGGIGTRQLVNISSWMEQLAWLVQQCKLCLSVCTGSALLAAAGCLDGMQATSNKFAWPWVVQQGSGKVVWQYKARWVMCGKFITSSGVAAGMDMALDIIAKNVEGGQELAERLANIVEYDWHRDAAWDPFADLYQHGC